LLSSLRQKLVILKLLGGIALASGRLAWAALILSAVILIAIFLLVVVIFGSTDKSNPPDDCKN
jgi:uncharacterized membrane protein YphA (DoxX/SURF4 family)